VQETTLHSETDADARISMAEPDRVDQTLDWGGSRMADGAAFADANSENPIRISKQWQQIDGQFWLIEAAVYGELDPLLQDLPVRTASLRIKSKDSPSGRRAARTPPQRSGFARSPENNRIQVASARVGSRSEPRVVLDYVL